MKRIAVFIALAAALAVSAQTIVHIDNPATWKASSLSSNVGKVVRFDVPFYVCNNYGGYLTVSPRRIMSPTNQALPSSVEYNTIVSNNSTGTIRLNGVSGYHRNGERIDGLQAYVNSTSSLTADGTQTFVGNTRADLATRPDLNTDDSTLVVCAMNLEYFLVENLGSGSMGPSSAAQQARQYSKIIKALVACNADLYGLVEIEQGQGALAKLAQGLTNALGRNFTYINDGKSANGTYTKAGYVYCSDRVKPYGVLRENNQSVQNRKKMQVFTDNMTGEQFIFSINHFKAKSGTGYGQDADQGDGQGIFNYTRTLEAQSVVSSYNSLKYIDPDILIMGDLNAYAKEDPIMTLTNAGMTDLHRYFHADSSYSYVFRGQAGYLDHALVSAEMLPQVAGMAAYHINSDESDDYTYDKSNDETMFRSSDHDPILVALHLGRSSTALADRLQHGIRIKRTGSKIQINNLNAETCHVRIYTPSGQLVLQDRFSGTEYTTEALLPGGVYIIDVYGYQTRIQQKLIIN